MVQIHLVLQGRCVRFSAYQQLIKSLFKHSSIHTMVLHTYPNPSTLNVGPLCEIVNTKYNCKHFRQISSCSLKELLLIIILPLLLLGLSL
jgi:hypothetical protein